MGRIGARVGGVGALAAVVVALGLPASVPVAAAVRGAHVDRYTATARIGADGTVRVRETVVYAYGAHAGTPATRTLPPRSSVGAAWARAYRLSNVTVGGPGRGVRGRVRDDGHGGKVIRVVDPHPHGRRVYTVAFDVAGVVDELAGQDVFRWDFLGGGWGVPVGRASVTVHAPVRVDGVVCTTGRGACDVARRSATSAVVGTRPTGRPRLDTDVILPYGSVKAVPAVEPGPSGGRITSYAVDARVRRDGTVHLTETIAYAFGDRPRHGIVRIIPNRRHVSARRDRLYTYTGIGVTSPDLPTPVTVTGSGDDTVIRAGEADRTHTGGPYRYVIAYDVHGGLTPYRDHDELYWNFVGGSWGVPIGGASVTVHVPGDVTRVACYAGAAGSRRRCTAARVHGGTARFTQRTLPAGAGLTAAIAFPTGAVRVPPPVYAARPGLFRPTVPGLAGVLVVLSFAVLGHVRHRSPRPHARLWGPVTAPPEPADPETGARRPVSPGHAAVLLGLARGRIWPATLLDLAGRGHLRIAPADDDGEPDWVLTRTTGDAADLSPDEAELLEWLFGDVGEVALSEVGRRRSTVVSTRLFVLRLIRDCTARRWLRRPASGTVPGWTLALAGASGVLCMLPPLVHGRAPAWADGLGYLPFAGLLAGVALIVWAARPALTAEGGAVRVALRAYRHHLETGAAPDASGRDLPYAVVFGLAGDYERRYATAHGTPDVTWYHGAGAAHFAATFVASATAGATTPSGSAGGGPSGGGFSGGASGGGGGGGGGGTW